MTIRKCDDCNNELLIEEEVVCLECHTERQADMELYYKEQEEFDNEREHHD